MCTNYVELSLLNRELTIMVTAEGVLGFGSTREAFQVYLYMLKKLNKTNIIKSNLQAKVKAEEFLRYQFLRSYD